MKLSRHHARLVRLIVLVLLIASGHWASHAEVSPRAEMTRAPQTGALS